MALLGSLLTGACSVVGIRSGTEEPAHTVIARPAASVEIRSYAPRRAAETSVSGSANAARGEGFNRLAGYIFGGNQAKASIAMTAPVAQAGQRIAMTAPVTQAAGPDGWVVQFFLPAALADPPQPNDARIRLTTVPAQTMAVLRFGGVANEAAIDARRSELLAALAGSGWQADGDPVSWFYDPPWTLPPFRRNEVAVPVIAAPG
ncbi:MAG: heme-binding protein [Gemmatimonadaceae bacterium]|nr:heme-binding protein [Acetobacteraceae bacterium]